MRKVQNNSNRYNGNDIVALGDSQSDYISGFGVQASDYWPEQLARILRAEGALVKSRTFARSGFTTSQLMCFVGSSFYNSTPKIAIIYDGVNDATGSNSTANGTAQAGSTATTIKLANTASAQDFTYVGNVISITAGTGSGQTRTVADYNGLTLVATLDTAWATTPDATSVYSIAAPTQAQQQRNHQALIKALKFKAVGVHARLGKSCAVWLPTMLPADGDVGQRYVVLNDNAASGGANGFTSYHHDTIAGNYSGSPKVTVWEFRNKNAGLLGWGRVAVDATAAFSEGVSKIITVSTNYLNYAAGGDNYNTNTSSGTQYAANIPVRAAAKAATVAEGTVFCDLYTFQNKLIVGGVFLGKTIVSETAQGSNSWHYAVGDQHHNNYGHETVARATYHTIVNQNWLSGLLT